MTTLTVPHNHALYCETESLASLNEVLTPWDQAKPGDFLGFTQSAFVPVDARGPRGGRHQVFWRKTEGGAEWVKYKDLAKEQHPELAKLAHLSLTVLNDAQWDRACEDPIEVMNIKDGETFWADVIFLPSCAVVTRDEIQYALEDADLDTLEDVQEMSHYIHVVMHPNESAHDSIELIGTIKRDLEALGAILNQKDTNGDPITYAIDIS